MISVLHFRKNEIEEFKKFCDRNNDISYEVHVIKDKRQPYSVHMKYTSMETFNAINNFIDQKGWRR